MSSNYEEEKPTDRLDLGGRYTKKQKQDNQVFTDWRTSNRIQSTDDIFKTLVTANKGRVNIHRTDSNQSVKVYHTDGNANRVMTSKDRRLYQQ